MSNTSSDSPKTPKRSPSPTTSTPAPTLEGSSNKELKPSELLYSEESFVSISTEQNTTIETDSKMEISLDEKSVDGASTQSIKEILCETKEGITSTQEITLDGKSVDDDASTQNIKEMFCENNEGNTSTQEVCEIANIDNNMKETSEMMRVQNLSQLLAEISFNETVKEAYETVSYNSVGLLTLQGSDMENLKPWYIMLRKINIAMKDISKIKESNKKMDMVKILENTREGQMEVAMEEVKNSMIEVENPLYKEAKTEIMENLKTLANINLGLSSTQTKQVENILRILITICIEYHLEINNNYLDMTSMTKLLFELLTLNQKLEHAEESRKEMKAEKEKLESNVVEMKNHLINTNNFLNQQIEAPKLVVR